MNRPDKSSFANSLSFQTSHLDLFLGIDFAARTISGHVDLHFKVLRAEDTQLVLDTRALLIHSVSLLETAAGTDACRAALHPLPHRLSASHPAFGQALTIDLSTLSLQNSPDSASLHVRVFFSTTAESSALQWLDPEQTAAKKQPFVFAMCQAIHARSFFPCQDSPFVRATFSASVTAPAHLQSLMSALVTGREVLRDGSDGQAGLAVTHFHQPVPIASYIIVLACGDIECRKISDRCLVWAEPTLIEAAAYEFGDMERYVQTAERLQTPFAWTTFVVLVMPKSFAYGGFEASQCVLVTPTLLAGDRSLQNVTIHELQHMWSGNLVTNSTHEHFWLNEGWTVFMERRIVGELYGEPVRWLEHNNGWFALEEAVKGYGPSHEFTKLVPSLDDVDPDDSFSSVPYEKGSAFLVHLEQLVDNKPVFDAYIRDYFTVFAMKNITTEDFKQHFLDFMQAHNKPVGAPSVDWDLWLHQPGMPPKPQFDDGLQQECIAAADGSTEMLPPIAQWSVWSTQQKLFFLDYLIKNKIDRITSRLLDTFEAQYLQECKNAEIVFRFLTLALKSKLAQPKHLDRVQEMLGSQGRMKFTRPLFRDLAAVDKHLAVALFEQFKNSYHVVCRKMASRDLGVA